MTNEQTPQQDDNQIIAERRAKLKAIREQGVAFPNDFERHDMAADLHAQYGEMSHDELEAAQIPVAVAGRMMLKRVMGKATPCSRIAFSLARRSAMIWLSSCCGVCSLVIENLWVKRPVSGWLQ